MKPDESFIGQPIRSLQTMLRTVAQIHPTQLSVVPDGVYSKQTEAAVSSFQRRKGLPVTGVADNRTWNMIVSEYDCCCVETSPAQILQITMNPGQVFRLGDENVQIPLVQTMLFVLSQIYEQIPEPEISGIWDMPTHNALMVFQTVSDLPATGELDKKTWKHLALQYTQATDSVDNGSHIN